jgi:hypothetical protein
LCCNSFSALSSIFAALYSAFFSTSSASLFAFSTSFSASSFLDLSAFSKVNFPQKNHTISAAIAAMIGVIMNIEV